MDTKKKFYEWIKIKEGIHNDQNDLYFKEREVWWIAAGENVGVEMNGKGTHFARPAIVYKKLSKFGCLVIPLTSQKHTGSWYVQFYFNNRTQHAVLAQMRVISGKRLYRRMGKLSEADYRKIADGLRQWLFPHKNTPNNK